MAWVKISEEEARQHPLWEKFCWVRLLFLVPAFIHVLIAIAVVMAAVVYGLLALWEIRISGGLWRCRAIYELIFLTIPILILFELQAFLLIYSQLSKQPPKFLKTAFLLLPTVLTLYLLGFSPVITLSVDILHYQNEYRYIYKRYHSKPIPKL